MDDAPCFCLLCAPTEWGGPVSKERDSRIAKSVAEFGWHVMGVAGGDAPGDWGYSIGLWHTLRSPEVSVFGLPSQTAMRVANAAGAAIRDGNPLEPGQHRGDVLNGYDVAVRPVHPSWYHVFFGAGIDFYQTRHCQSRSFSGRTRPGGSLGKRERTSAAARGNHCSGFRKPRPRALGPKSREQS
ncbi:DUF4262 domain-containing protein [Streptomyces sp. NPDC049915]|uniref:DUF4262 domain-containing protein n=1 Tax=Streptomyces sp. NPDC049915 TaxID=3155510 RepID=UPI00341668F3